MDCPAQLSHNCNHAEDAGVRCDSVTYSGKYFEGGREWREGGREGGRDMEGEREREREREGGKEGERRSKTKLIISS